MKNQGFLMLCDQNNQVCPEKGIALWYILAGVVLFAALSFSFMRSVNNSAGSSNRERVNIEANNILRYAKSIEQAVERLRLVYGCGENEVSFYSSEWATPANYDNIYTPVADGDFSCHVFHQDGGGVNFQKPQGNDDSEYVFSGRLRVAQVGTDNVLSGTDLLIILPNVNLDVCMALNKALGTTSPTNPPQDATNANYIGSYFQGTFTSGNVIDGDMIGLPSGCFEGANNPAPDTYHFYHVLITR